MAEGGNGSRRRRWVAAAEDGHLYRIKKSKLVDRVSPGLALY